MKGASIKSNINQMGSDGCSETEDEGKQDFGMADMPLKIKLDNSANAKNG